MEVGDKVRVVNLDHEEDAEWVNEALSDLEYLGQDLFIHSILDGDRYPIYTNLGVAFAENELEVIK